MNEKYNYCLSNAAAPRRAGALTAQRGEDFFVVETQFLSGAPL